MVPLSTEPVHCDVLVAGGGAAGIGAALGARAAGASVLLLEHGDQLGGKATNAMVGTVCGALLRSFGDHAQWAIRDPLRSLCERLMERSATKPERGTDGLWYLPYRIAAFDEVATEILSNVGVRIHRQAFVGACDHSAGSIIKVSARSQDGAYTIVPKAVVDSSGNAHVSMICKAEIIREEEYQAPTQVFFVGGVKVDRVEGLELVIARALLRAADAGLEAAEAIGHVGVLHGSHHQASLGLKVTLKHRVKGDDDFHALNARGKQAALQVLSVLNNGTDVFKSAYVQEMAPTIGVRTEQRPLGKHVLTETEVLSATKPLDGVAVGAWPIEHWGDGRGADMQWLPEGEHYSVPAGALTSASLNNLYFGGRGISATEMAIASARVIGTCLGTGYAAGMLAAYRALGKPQSEAIERLRSEQLPKSAP